ncbi:MAG: pseudouridine synthase [Chlamydiae bacterium GWC2_50_10]|nr:MAG: pseudouridine synthase [Chlamydiae bacterium GWA2_50_15]OGN54190.1 MAG: pseudouridine synthase [Chlamydiae bacterium GWC2_50_10]OGN55928.1 MAG: pseudouridine synthase [Chlamydiae bacterium GWF2_49_8]OGN59062.1 MAG: pseudouridine synthase [Chlamydiae bacterium RIFCSPHIGHO2_02_FULL_49_29]OGN64575.1 MAG: pseudouridine synthase [Chlamydiae bacterium RIFCSPHIGHO2_12_FULL_49_32]OGN71131.1 MAG: pseudouridine synthase [Chlamydiae bacterium RIFCSPLOWO2_02_FULL_49_12]OGN73407.1 MAG: pseudouridi
MERKLRLSKALAAAGIASRRKCEELIFAGKVEVNKETVLLPQTLVTWGKDRIVVEGREVKGEEARVCYLFHKPHGYICSNRPAKGKKLVVDLFRSTHSRLFTVGRLDRDTTGLLLVTNDGEFAHRVIHPSFELSKEYLVKTKEEVRHDHLALLSKGMLLERVWIRPQSVKKVRRGTLKIAVMEGKKREVRLLIQNAGLTLLSLKRIRLGPLTLGMLPEGAYRELSQREYDLLLKTDHSADVPAHGS